MCSISAAATQEPLFCLDHIVYVSYKKIHSQGLLSMSHCLESLVQSNNNNKSKGRRQKQKTIVLFLEEEKKVSDCWVSPRQRSWGRGGQRDKGTCHGARLGEELEPQSLMLRRVCDVVCAFGWVEWVCVCQLQCMSACVKYNASYNKKAAIIHFNEPMFALRKRRTDKSVHVCTSCPYKAQLVSNLILQHTVYSMLLLSSGQDWSSLHYYLFIGTNLGSGPLANIAAHYTCMHIKMLTKHAIKYYIHSPEGGINIFSDYRVLQND